MTKRNNDTVPTVEFYTHDRIKRPALSKHFYHGECPDCGAMLSLEIRGGAISPTATCYKCDLFMLTVAKRD